MASVDQIYAFYSIPMFNDHQKYLKFEWLEKIYYFTGMPNGYSEAMRIFNKILKPSFSRLLHWLSFSHIYGALRDLVPFVQFKKREKHP